MANILPKEKQIAIVGALAERMSICAIERLTGVHRATIMRLGVRVGEGYAELLDDSMRDLNSTEIQVDEVWGFIGKKQVNATLSERAPWRKDQDLRPLLPVDTQAGRQNP